MRFFVLAGALLSSGGFSFGQEKKEVPEPPSIKALLVTGGASHDYASRKEVIVRGIRDRTKRRIEWKVRHEGDGESDVRIPLFESALWAEGYDIVVHDYCFPRVTDRDYVDRILAPHRGGLPAVLIHGTMHSFRTGDDRWFEFCGVTSRGHDKDFPLLVEPAIPAHPILGGMKPWAIPRGQLYRIEGLQSGMTALTRSMARDREAHVNSWTHLYGPEKARVFGTTIGNETSTMLTPEYLDLITRGFLWALKDLSDETFLILPPEKAVPDLPFALPEAGLQLPGPNEARGGRASALSQKREGGTGAEKAIDGDLFTHWEAEGPGPCSWQVDLRAEKPVGAIAVTWRDSAPGHYLIEGSDNLLSWRVLAEVAESSGSPAQSLHLVTPGKVRHLRVSIPETPPGFIPGMREFAVFRSEDEVPSALLHGSARHATSPVPLPVLTAAREGFGRNVRLAPGWSMGAVLALGEGETPLQLIPRASGGAFVFVNSGDGSGTAKVYCLSRTDDGKFPAKEFLIGLLPATTVAWDGEWLYTLSDGDLNAYRDTAGDGRADERFRIGPVIALSESEGGGLPAFSQMRMSPDGWLYALVESAEGSSGVNSLGERIPLPRHGIVRFKRDGRDFNVYAESRTSLDRFPSMDPDHYCGESGPVASGDRVYAREGTAGADGTGVREIARVEGLMMMEDDGDRVWFASRNGERCTIACLTTSSGENESRVEWDDVRAADLFAHLSSRHPTVRREAAFEILRRKRNPVADLERLLDGDPSPELVEGVLSALSGVKGRNLFPDLLRLAQAKDPALQRIAFRHLGDHPEATNDPVFDEISRSTVPAVTAAILAAVLRSGTTIDGLDDLVLSFAAHQDQDLAAAAFDFLIERESSDVCFDTLDDPDREEEWRTALEVLSGINRVSVVEGLMERLEKTKSPLLRRLGMETLTRLYFQDQVPQATWEGTKLVDSFLQTALADHRVDTAALLSAMHSTGIPLRPVTIVELAKGEIPLEAIAVESLLGSEEPLPGSSLNWLDEIAGSRNRDGDLRLRALGIMVRHSPRQDYRKHFERTARRHTIVSMAAASSFVRGQWLSRRDHSENVAWLIQQGRGDDEAKGVLAWETLLSIRSRAEASSAVRGAIDAAAAAMKGKGGFLRNRLLTVRTSLSGSTDFDTAPAPDVVGGMKLAEVVAAMESMELIEPVPYDGCAIFWRLSCDACHNIHGEGPSAGPDLATAMKSLSAESLVASILHSPIRTNPEYESHLFELKDGMQLRGFVESRDDTVLSIRDRAGNVFEIATADLRFEWSDAGAIKDCDAAADLTLPEFASLLSYLHALTSP